MSWLTDLAGKAENLLNKIDQNAANVLKDRNLINDQLTDVIWNPTNLKSWTSTQEDESSQYESISPNNFTSMFPRLTRSSPSGAPSPTLRSSPCLDQSSFKKNNEEDLVNFLNQGENASNGVEDARGSPLGASIPSSPVPSCSHSRNPSQGGTSSVSSSCTGHIRDDRLPQHCFKPVQSLETSNGSHLSFSDIVAENNMLKNEVRCLNNEMSLLHQRCKAAEKEVSVAGIELQSLKAVSSQNENLEKELLSLQLEVSNYRRDSNRSSDKDIRQKELIAASEKIEQWKIENEGLVEEVKELHLQIARLQAAMTEAAQLSERHREQLMAVTQEAEQYRIRATRVLQDKERLITSLQEGETCKGDSNTTILEQEVEQLKEELHLLHVETTSQAELLRKARQDFQELEAQKEQNRLDLENEIERLKNRFQEERSRRVTIEEDFRNQTEELRKVRSDCSHEYNRLEERLKETQAELLQSQSSHPLQPSQGHIDASDLEARVRHLATALIQKQGALEALIAERNALQLHIEQNERRSKLSPSHSSGGTGVNHSENALRSRVPTLMTESPMDNEVARHVKRAYSGLDKLGIQVGVFLRRYPLARIFVIFYMVFLHFWVALVLFTYSTESHSAHQVLELSPISPIEPSDHQ